LPVSFISLRLERVDNLGAYRIPSETGILIPCVFEQLAPNFPLRYLAYMDSAQPAAPDRFLIAVSKVVAFLLLGIVVVAFLLTWSCEAPSDESLGNRFRTHRSELETLVRMSQEDADVIRVADDFTRVKNDWGWPRPESKWGITRERWDEYRRLFHKVGLSGGFNKDEAGNVFFIAHSEGFVSGGSAKGFVHCVTVGDVDKTLPPCKEQRYQGQVGQPDKGSSYRELSPDWYIFETWD
jgi:hypothetical protein